eukprot:TRINITY_DN103949_c0_g1_i1.p1 TRINITY_DN103949_c0_g1~~TRINITY_DN103949_c0_g1_i1.p1  ORF type:complete len:239 (+),score=51.12 TRINITY_DN103949_c0_g1_i1:32-718(+)
MVLGRSPPEVNTVWSHPCLPRSAVRRPWQVWRDTISDCDGGTDDRNEKTFELLPHGERQEYLEVAMMELAAFLAWLISKASGCSSAEEVLSKLGRRQGMLAEVELAWASLPDEAKAAYVPSDFSAFLARAWAPPAVPAKEAPAPGKRSRVFDPETPEKLTRRRVKRPIPLEDEGTPADVEQEADVKNACLGKPLEAARSIEQPGLPSAALVEMIWLMAQPGAVIYPDP